MLIPLNRAAEFGCHVTRAWPPDTPEKTPSRMCAGRRCAAWTTVWMPGQVAFNDTRSTRPGTYRAVVEIGVCGLLPRSLGNSEIDAADVELRARLAELTHEAGVLKFEPRPSQPRSTVLSARPDDPI